MCECYQIGGPWIAEDPSCPVHGTDGTLQRADRATDEFERWYSAQVRHELALEDDRTVARLAWHRAIEYITEQG